MFMLSLKSLLEAKAVNGREKGKCFLMQPGYSDTAVHEGFGFFFLATMQLFNSCPLHPDCLKYMFTECALPGKI